MSRDVMAHFGDLASRLAPGCDLDAPARNEPELLKRYPSLPAWPFDAVLALHLMALALGPGFRLPEFRSAAGRFSPDFKACALSCEIPHKGRHGLVALNFWNGWLFRNAAVVTSLKMDPERIYFPVNLAEMLGVEI